MLIQLRKDQFFPHLEGKKGIQEVRIVCNWWDQPTHSNYSQFVDTKEELDKIPDYCDSVSVMFDDGTYVEMPLSAFKGLFRVIPKGELTSALYGD